MRKIVPLLLAVLVSIPVLSQDIDIEFFADGFDDPVNLQNAGDERLFVVEQGGAIRILNPSGTTNATSFLNIAGLVGSGSEQGLLGLAFHPDFSNNGFFYVNYVNTSGNTEVVRYTVDSTDPDLADATSALPIISYNQPFSNHNGGHMAFGPDGFLYIASGDGGSGGDPGNRAQNLETPLGKLLRIDVDNPVGGGQNYGIPADNPFAGDPSLTQEIWAYGLRNPWRFSFDTGSDDLWIADVGQGEIEEINRVNNSDAAVNYGWRCYEGSMEFNNDATCPPESTMTFPVAEYPHPTGFSITGGYVYRGSTYPGMQGLYFFADFVTGIIGTVDQANNLVNHGNFSGSWASFGVDMNEELYIVSIGGTIHRVKDNNLGAEGFDMSDVSLSPNPATHTVTVDVSQATIQRIDLIDMHGRVISSEETPSVHSKTLNTSALRSGLYFVSVETTSGERSTKKLMIE